MNCLKTIIVVAAACVALATASPCTDQCTGACDLSKTECDMAVLLGPFCSIAHGICNQGCGAICGCVDGCDASCGAAKDSCQASATNILAKAQCLVENDVCVVDCQAVCGLQSVAGAVTALVQQGLGMVSP